MVNAHEAIAQTAKRPTRRNVDARREQNRIASRNYRQKRKQKLALLNQLLDDGDGQTQAEEAPNAPAEATAANAAAAAAEFVSIDGSVRGDMLFGTHTDSGWRWDRTFSGPSPMFGPDALAAWKATELVSSTGRLDNKSSSSEEEPAVRSSSSSSSSSSLQNEKDDLVLNVLSNIRGFSQQQKQDLIRYLQGQTADLTMTESPTSARHSLPFHNAASSPAASAGTRLQAEARRFSEFIERNPHCPVSPVNLTRIYSAQAGFFGAIFANCFAMGMSTIDPLMLDDGASLFSLDQETGYHPSQLKTVRPKFANITPDLRPTDVQLTLGHHPYLDVIPFQGFRDRSLKAIQAAAPFLDEEELCLDLVNGGMVCWGSQMNNLGMEAGVPWDKRSWEPRVWFLKKYWFLVGDWYDEMWERTRWWHRMRGEKIRDD